MCADTDGNWCRHDDRILLRWFAYTCGRPTVLGHTRRDSDMSGFRMCGSANATHYGTKALIHRRGRNDGLLDRRWRRGNERRKDHEVRARWVWQRTVDNRVVSTESV